MAVWTVHAKGDPREPTVAESAVFVKEGFSLFAFLVPAVYLVAYRLWLALLLYVIGLVAINGAGMLLGTNPLVLTLVGSVYSALFGLEAPALRQRRLARDGFAHVGSVVAKTAEDAETTYFRALAAEPASPTLRDPPPTRSNEPRLVGRPPETLLTIGDPGR